ncbi:hypothetical protein OPV22_013879 [Ensete ventricosum]|uniref:Nudix hydrolase domain-containing protein n=1 Tax=Ensete ventricosum TaxID=4639 RepID=A0AAV8PJ90_ENSVE|nr:hypothetical protein OPV22_013879 [Ensete ventricosum]
MRDGVMLGSDAPRAAPPPPSSIYSRLLAELVHESKSTPFSFPCILLFRFSWITAIGGGGSNDIDRTKMVSMVSRQGRQLQRYSKTGSRIVVGCIPYKFNAGGRGGIRDDDIGTLMEVLVVSSPKGNGLLFPKGGWETDETIEQAALREALEEAGVQGNVEGKLGKWRYKSRAYDAYHEGIMFPMNVTQELGDWPEMHLRERKWVTVAEAKEGCQHPWMKEALERLVRRVSSSRRNSAAPAS